MPFSAAAFGEGVVEGKWPVTMAFFTSPALARFTTLAASTLDGMAGSTDSVPDIRATLGFGLPSACAISIALLVMSIFVSVSGCTLTAASVIIRTRSLPGTVMWKIWLRRRLVRRPCSRLTTAFIRASVCKWPFISE